jgi:transcriptional regulator with XRE-family HTH domain
VESCRVNSKDQPVMPPKSSAHLALGAAIRATRQEQGYTQERFALASGIDRSYYGALERGEFNLTLDTLTKVAAGLEMPAWELLHRAQL